MSCAPTTTVAAATIAAAAAPSAVRVRRRPLATSFGGPLRPDAPTSPGPHPPNSYWPTPSSSRRSIRTSDMIDPLDSRGDVLSIETKWATPPQPFRTEKANPDAQQLRCVVSLALPAAAVKGHLTRLVDAQTPADPRVRPLPDARIVQVHASCGLGSSGHKTEDLLGRTNSLAGAPWPARSRETE